MAAPADVPLQWVRGDDETVTVYIYSDAGVTPVDITGRTYTLSVATAAGVTPALALTGTVTGASGLASFTATDTQTTALTAGQYVYDVVEVSGSAESTILRAALTVTERVTA